MNKDNAAQFLPLVKALAEGKTIQFCVMGNQWEDVKSVGFNYDPKRYRIKSEPRVLYVNEYADAPEAGVVVVRVVELARRAHGGEVR